MTWYGDNLKIQHNGSPLVLGEITSIKHFITHKPSCYFSAVSSHLPWGRIVEPSQVERFVHPRSCLHQPALLLLLRVWQQVLVPLQPCFVCTMLAFCTLRFCLGWTPFLFVFGSGWSLNVEHKLMIIGMWLFIWFSQLTQISILSMNIK